MRTQSTAFEKELKQWKSSSREMGRNCKQKLLRKSFGKATRSSVRVVRSARTCSLVGSGKGIENATLSVKGGLAVGGGVV